MLLVLVLVSSGTLLSGVTHGAGHKPSHQPSTCRRRPSRLCAPPIHTVICRWPCGWRASLQASSGGPSLQRAPLRDRVPGRASHVSTVRGRRRATITRGIQLVCCAWPVASAMPPFPARAQSTVKPVQRANTRSAMAVPRVTRVSHAKQASTARSAAVLQRVPVMLASRAS